MDHSKSSPRLWCIPKRWFHFIVFAIIICIIIAVVVPLGVILPKRGHHGPESTVILPLYIYPNTSTAWSPLYDVLEAHPQLQFLVIVNPSSGPGSSEFPDENFSAELPKLNNYTNVQTVGYVRTGYATQNISFVISEVNTYAGWATKESSFAMHGIFFDESPYEYSAAAVEYMQTINQAVKNSTLQGAKTVIHNPGVIPDSRYDDPNLDITVVFEDSYQAYQTKLADLDALSPSNRSHYSFMVNSVPTQSTADLKTYVGQLSKRAEYLFATNNDQDFYESFGSDWANFTDVVGSLLT